MHRYLIVDRIWFPNCEDFLNFYFVFCAIAGGSGEKRQRDDRCTHSRPSLEAVKVSVIGAHKFPQGELRFKDVRAVVVDLNRRVTPLRIERIVRFLNSRGGCRGHRRLSLVVRGGKGPRLSLISF